MLRQQARPGLLVGSSCRQVLHATSLPISLRCYPSTVCSRLGRRIATAASSKPSSSNHSSSGDKGKAKPEPKGKGFGGSSINAHRRRQDLQQQQQQSDGTSEAAIAASSNRSSDSGSTRDVSTSSARHHESHPSSAAVPESPPPPQASAPGSEAPSIPDTPEPPELPEVPDSRPDTPETPDSPFPAEPEPDEPSAYLSGPGRDRSDEQAYEPEEAQPLPQGSAQGWDSPVSGPEPQPQAQTEASEGRGEGSGAGQGGSQGGREQEGPTEAGDSASLQAVPTAAVLLERPTADTQTASSEGPQQCSSSSSRTDRVSSSRQDGGKQGREPDAAAATEHLLQGVKSRVGPFKEATGLDSSAFLKELNRPAINSLKSLDTAERVRKGEAAGLGDTSSRHPTGSTASDTEQADADSGSGPAASDAGVNVPAAPGPAEPADSSSTSSSAAGLPTVSLSEDLQLMAETAGAAASGPSPLPAPAAGVVWKFELATGRVQPDRLQQLQEAAGEVASAGSDRGKPDGTAQAPAATLPSTYAAADIGAGASTDLTQDLEMMGETQGTAAAGPAGTTTPAAGGLTSSELRQSELQKLPAERLHQLEAAAGETADAGAAGDDVRQEEHSNPVSAIQSAASSSAQQLSDTSSAAAANVVSTGKEAAGKLGIAAHAAADKVDGATRQLAAATATAAQQAAAISQPAATKVKEAAVEGGKQAVQVGQAAAEKVVEGSKVSAQVVAEGSAAGNATVKAAKVGGNWAVRAAVYAGSAAAEGADILAGILRRMWSIVFRATQLSSMLLLEGARRVMVAVAGLLSAAAHRLLLHTAHPAEVATAAHTLAGSHPTPHYVPADMPTAASSAGVADAADPAGGGAAAVSAAPGPAPAVLSSILEAESAAGPQAPDTSSSSCGRVMTVSLSGSSLQAGAETADVSTIAPAASAATPMPAALQSADIKDISKLWGISEVVTPMPPAPASPTRSPSTSITSVNTSSAKQAVADHPHKKVNLSKSIAHVVPSVPSVDRAAERPSKQLDALTAQVANTLGLAHVTTISTAAGSLRAAKNTLSDTPVGEAAADAAETVKGVASSAASAAAAVMRPRDWLSAGKAVLSDVRAMVSTPATLMTWDAPDMQDNGQGTANGASSSSGSSIAAASGTVPAAAEMKAATAVAASVPVGTTGEQLPAAVNGFFGHGMPPSIELSAASGPSESGLLLGQVHELLHDLLRLEDQLLHQLQHVHDVQHRLDQAILLQQQNRSAASTTTDTGEGSATAPKAADAAAGADAADDLDTSGISGILLGDLKADLRSAERQLQHLEVSAASILTQVMVADASLAPPPAASSAAGAAAGTYQLPRQASEAGTAAGGNSSSGSSTPGGRLSNGRSSSRLHGDRPALGFSSSSSSRRSWQSPESKQQQVLAQQLLAAGAAGLMSEGEMSNLLQRVAKGEDISVAGTRGSGGGRASLGGSRGGGGGVGSSRGGSGGSGGGGSGRNRGRGYDSGGDDGAHHGGISGFVQWLLHLRAKHVVRLLFQVWLASVVVLGSVWYAYQLLYKVPVQEIKSMTSTAVHVAAAGKDVASKTASAASHVAHAVGGGAGSSAETDDSWGVGSAAKAGLNKLGGAVKGLGRGINSLAQQPAKAAGSVVQVTYGGGKQLARLLLPGAGGKQQLGSSTTRSSATAADGTQGPNPAAVAAARLGVGALLLLLANRQGGGDSSSGLSKKSKGSRAPDGADYYYSGRGYSSVGSKAAAAKASAANAANNIASSSATLASALSAMPSWFLSNIKTVTGSSRGHRAGAGNSTSSSGPQATASRNKGQQVSAAAAAPAGVMGFEDGVMYEVPGSSPAGTTAAGHHKADACGASGVAPGTAVWGADTALLAPDAAAGRGQHGLVSDADQQQLQVMYRSLSVRQGSWR